MTVAEKIVIPPASVWKRRAARLLAEPLAHFFVLGALLFVAHRLLVGDPRVIVVTPGVRAEVARRFRDSHDRAPSPSELDEGLHGWEREEALYREALRDHLDRNDATIRKFLADVVRSREARSLPQRPPTQAELDEWLATHRGVYETPRRYDYATVAFAKTDRGAAAEREAYERSMKAGTDPRTLGRNMIGGNLTAEQLNERVGPALAAQIEKLPAGRAQRAENENELLLVWVNAVEGGLPEADELHKRLLADWTFARRQTATDRAVQVIVDRYRVEERP